MQVNIEGASQKENEMNEIVTVPICYKEIENALLEGMTSNPQTATETIAATEIVYLRKEVARLIEQNTQAFNQYQSWKTKYEIANRNLLNAMEEIIPNAPCTTTAQMAREVVRADDGCVSIFAHPKECPDYTTNMDIEDACVKCVQENFTPSEIRAKYDSLKGTE
jgi:hypothetical protein